MNEPRTDLEEALDSLDMALDADHPEGHGCPVCQAADGARSAFGHLFGPMPPAAPLPFQPERHRLAIEAEAAAIPREAPLDVERLALAMFNTTGRRLGRPFPEHEIAARAIAAEYARLADTEPPKPDMELGEPAPSQEEQP